MNQMNVINHSESRVNDAERKCVETHPQKMS